MSLSTRIAPHLPYLRRFSRAVTGSQTSGDAYVAATLEAIIADLSVFPQASNDRIALYKLFSPEGAATWLLCSLAPDGDTLWAVCDLGLGYVEYGTVSLAELETLVTPKFKLHVELDRHFDGSKLDVGELLRRDRVGV